MNDPWIMTLADWEKAVSDVNRSAQDEAAPDWIVARVLDGGRGRWMWHVALPIGCLLDSDYAQQYVVHGGEARSRAVADRRVQRCVERYDAELLGVDPRDPMFRATRNALLALTGALALVYAVLAAGMPVSGLWVACAACLALTLAVEVLRRSRALGFTLDR